MWIYFICMMILVCCVKVCRLLCFEREDKVLVIGFNKFLMYLYKRIRFINEYVIY